MILSVIDAVLTLLGAASLTGTNDDLLLKELFFSIDTVAPS